MHKYFWFFPFLVLSIFLFGFSSNELNRENSSPNITPTPTPVNLGDSAKVVLDKDVVCLPCSPGGRPVPGSDCNQNMTIVISAVKPEKNQFKYEYTVSGGRIIGEGAKVIWNMNGTQPGTYQVRTDIQEKSSGQKWSETKMITVQNSNCICDCECPTIEVTAPTLSTTAGDTITFTANVSGGSASEVTYNWTISAGEIVEGQGTPVIRVATNSKMAGKTVKATVEIGGVCEDCTETESAEVSITSVKSSRIKP